MVRREKRVCFIVVEIYAAEEGDGVSFTRLQVPRATDV